MWYRFSDSGEGDIRVRRSRTGFKETYLQMLGEMDSSAIMVSDLAARAEINRKTFYLHYKNLSALRDEIADDMARSLDEQFNGDMKHDILALYEFLDAQDEGVSKLFTEPGFNDFRMRFCDQVFTEGAFGACEARAKDPSMIAGYFTGILGTYIRYVEKNPEKKNLKRLAGKVAELVLFGISGGGTA